MAQYKGASDEARRAQVLIQRREQEKQDLEDRKRKIKDDMQLGDIDRRFSTQLDSVEQSIKSKTVGLVTLDEMKARQQLAAEEREKQCVQKRLRLQQISAGDSLKLQKSSRISAAVLSFPVGDDDDEEESTIAVKHEHVLITNTSSVTLAIVTVEPAGDDDLHAEKAEIRPSVDNDDDDANEKREAIESLALVEQPPADEESTTTSGPPLKKRLGKNPDVDTSFLPDRDREEDEKRLREQLRLEWQQKQELTKRESVEIVFSYWDGSGHRRSVTMKKGDTIFQFLNKAHEILKREFNELRTAMPDQLVYVKEDLILPHHYSFYDFIVTKARGKSGPLFSFDVHEDVRIISDAKKEKNESHAGKVVLRSWYERNKHIFPASRWEPWDPHRRYDKYTIKDKK